MKSIFAELWIRGAYHKHYTDPFLAAYFMARDEHAFLLRCEGLTIRQISARIEGGSSGVARMIFRGAYRLNRAMRKTRFRLEHDV